MKIKDNIINPSLKTRLLEHGQKLLWGKPKGTYFFSDNTKNGIALVFSAGGTKIGVLNLDLQSDGKINLTDRVKGNTENSFISETEFFNYIKENGFVSPTFPNKRFYLATSVNEFSKSIPSLQYLVAVSIFKNPALSSQFWSNENTVTEELEDFVFKVNEQMKTLKLNQ
jgi:hypothetical protein